MRCRCAGVPEVLEHRAFEKHQRRTHLYKHYIMGLVCPFLMGGYHYQRFIYYLWGSGSVWRYKSGWINMHYRYEGARFDDLDGLLCSMTGEIVYTIQLTLVLP